MSILSIHPVEYLKIHLHYEEVKLRLLSLFGWAVEKVCKPSEQTATIAVVLLIIGLVICVSIKLAEFTSVGYGYCSCHN